MVPNEAIEGDDQHNGNSSGEEGSYPHYDCRVGVIAISASREGCVLPMYGEVHRCDDIDPAHGHRHQVGQQDNNRADHFSGPGLGKVLLGCWAAEDQVALDGEHHHNPGGAVERAVL